MIFSSRTTIDSFFRICEEARITVPETMKYICNTEAVALYLQKYIAYRKRKISFADGTFNSLLELIVKHKDEKFILALTEPFKPELPDTLLKFKLKVSPVVFARTVAADMSDLKPESYDIIALYSPSDVNALVKNYDVEKLPVVATFGEATLRAAIDAGLRVKASAPSPEAPSMVKALDIYCSKCEEGVDVEDAQVKEDLDKEEFIRAQQSKLQKKTRTRTRKAQ
jgi:uroporphyrinogen-III synthase